MAATLLPDRQLKVSGQQDAAGLLNGEPGGIFADHLASSLRIQTLDLRIIMTIANTTRISTTVPKPIYTGFSFLLRG
jgi:hypothetical protein